MLGIAGVTGTREEEDEEEERVKGGEEAESTEEAATVIGGSHSFWPSLLPPDFVERAFKGSVEVILVFSLFIVLVVAVVMLPLPLKSTLAIGRSGVFVRPTTGKEGTEQARGGGGGTGMTMGEGGTEEKEAEATGRGGGGKAGRSGGGREEGVEAIVVARSCSPLVLPFVSLPLLWVEALLSVLAPCKPLSETIGWIPGCGCTRPRSDSRIGSVSREKKRCRVWVSASWEDERGSGSWG